VRDIEVETNEVPIPSRDRQGVPHGPTGHQN